MSQISHRREYRVIRLLKFPCIYVRLILTHRLKWALHARFISFICSHSRQTYNWSNFLYLQHNASHPWGWSRAQFPTRTSLRVLASIAETSGRIAHGEWITDLFMQRVAHKSDAIQIRKFDHINSVTGTVKNSRMATCARIASYIGASHAAIFESTWPFIGCYTRRVRCPLTKSLPVKTCRSIYSSSNWFPTWLFKTRSSGSWESSSSWNNDRSSISRTTRRIARTTRPSPCPSSG